MFALFSQNSLFILTVMLVGVLSYATVLQLRFDAEKVKMEAMKLQETLLQSDLSILRGVIKTQTAQQQIMVDEFDILAELNKANSQAKQTLSQELDQQIQLLDRLMEAENEQVYVWANEPIPMDISRVLEYASDCANIGLQLTSVCTAAQEYDSAVSDPLIFK
ncbi:hypothetical protein [Shewanella surugensis]|uniref:Uncharacterized protein n=1 Tax=Shewanella surugensis TaxID=212020 RepID=A0ABT0LC30_9GAMM|nr:hypothetical protein [Shewanella surugensis]MCL1125219.1 hypothetical protein [Shewanella surugensis]